MHLSHKLYITLNKVFQECQVHERWNEMNVDEVLSARKSKDTPFYHFNSYINSLISLISVKWSRTLTAKALHKKYTHICSG